MPTPRSRPSSEDRADTVLNPAARLLWRDAHSVQLELGDRAVLIDGVDSAIVRRLVGGRRDGRIRPSGRSGATGPAPDPELPAAVAARLSAVAAELTAEGFLVPERARPGSPSGPAFPRLAGEFASLGARHGAAGATVLAARRRRLVTVYGDGSSGPLLVALLAAAGVGRVNLAERGRVRLHHLLPGGATPADENLPLSDAAVRAAARVAPEARTEPPGPAERADLVVLAADEPVDPPRRDALHRQHRPHLLVSVSAGHGQVGPLVVPGRTACLRCADLHRLDRDPAWTALAAQLSSPPSHAFGAAAALGAVITGVAAMQALAFLDGEPLDQIAAVDGTLHLRPPAWQLRRRSWPPHPDCALCAGR